MKVGLIFAVGTLLEGLASGFVVPRQKNPGVIAANVFRRDRTRSVENDIRRRSQLLERATSGTVQQILDNTPTKLLYFANSKTPLPQVLLIWFGLTWVLF